MALVTEPTFQILGPPNISGTADKDTSLKFYMQIDHKGYCQKKCKIGQKGA